MPEADTMQDSVTMEHATDSDWIASEGWPVMALAGGVTILLALVSLPLGCIALGLLVWLRHTLRLPSRRAPGVARAVLAPADGSVVEVTDAEAEPPAGTSVGPGHRITIRTGLADAHLQRSPVAGRVTDNFLIPGLFRSTADTALARRDNERREITIEIGMDGAPACVPSRARQVSGCRRAARHAAHRRHDRPVPAGWKQAGHRGRADCFGRRDGSRHKPSLILCLTRS